MGPVVEQMCWPGREADHPQLPQGTRSGPFTIDPVTDDGDDQERRFACTSP